MNMHITLPVSSGTCVSMPCCFRAQPCLHAWMIMYKVKVGEPKHPIADAK